MEYWLYHNKKMRELRKVYEKMSEKTKIQLQKYFKLFDLNSENIYEIASKKDKQKINIIIDEWGEKSFFKGYFGVLAEDIYRRSRVKNSDILELLIYGTFIQEQKQLDNIENNIIYDDMNYYYQEGQKEVNNELYQENNKDILSLSDEMFILLLSMNNSYGYELKTYKSTLVKNITDKIYKQAIINIQQQKELNSDDIEFEQIFDRQIDSKIKIKEDRIWGGIDAQIIELNNKAKLEGIKVLDKEAKVRFIAVEDDATTKMCNSLNGKIFNVHNWNVFERYSKTNDRMTKYKCYGLIPGLNLPPIDDGFHWCRSTLKYISKEEFDYQERERLFKKSIMSYNTKGIDKIALIQNIMNANKVIKDFPIIEGKIGRIVITESEGYFMSTKPKIKDYTLYISSLAFNSIDYIKNLYNEMVIRGEAPKNSTYKDILIHELGHIVLNEYINKKYGNNYEMGVFDWNNDITAQEIINKAYNGININFNKKSTIAKISNYANRNDNEAIAEAFVDYYVNKEKCRPISNEIIKILKGGL